MKEEFLQYVWRTKRFDMADLRTTRGEVVEILHTGTQNFDGGPDFLNAKIRVDGTLWVGNVEVHLKASDWARHGHDKNPAYNNVVLHIVLTEDQPATLLSGGYLPCVALHGRIAPALQATYQKLLANEHWIPCEKFFDQTTKLVQQAWLDRLLVERLEHKTAQIDISLDWSEQDWEQVFYQFMARAFGMQVNAQPFELLAKSLPLLILAKHKDNLFQIETLLFGQAGMLNVDATDGYVVMMKSEYAFLQQKFRLQPIRNEMWQFFRLRPNNFPTIRIAQFASLIYRSTHLFSKILEAEDVSTIVKLFQNVRVSDYWQTRYTFGTVSEKNNKNLGIATIHHLIINTVIPFLFLYGIKKGNELYKTRALSFLEALPAENNTITEHWKQLGLQMSSAYHTQAALQLKKLYCDKQKCLHCAICHAILAKA